jgi:hypothetical protein
LAKFIARDHEGNNDVKEREALMLLLLAGNEMMREGETLRKTNDFCFAGYRLRCNLRDHQL